MATVVLLGTLDTKGAEYGYLRDRLREQGVDVLVVDAGIFEPQIDADIAHDEVAAAAGADLTALRDAGDRGAAVEAMCLGAAEVVRRLHAEGRLDGFLSVGGSGNSSIGAAAARALPVGVPKLIVSTVASGDTRPYMGAKDVSMTYSVVDISGLNRISERILSNAAGAIAGMAKMTVPESGEGRPLIGATMFGVTTPAVTRARERLEELGYEVLVFHATGTGGQSMEALARGGFLAGVLDLTTTELADELVGGVLSAGPDRLEAAGELGLPQVVSLGALDMVNFGPRETVPPQFEDRNIYVHNPTVTLMRTTPDGVRGARPPDRAEAVRGDRADRAVRAAEGRLDDRHGGRAVPRPGGGRSALLGAARRAGRERRAARARPGRQRPRLRRRDGEPAPRADQ